jgi:hypothetical protein
MRYSRRSLLALAAVAPVLAHAAAAAAAPDPLSPAIARVRPLFKPKTAPQPGDWLAEHKEAVKPMRNFAAPRSRRSPTDIRSCAWSRSDR